MTPVDLGIASFQPKDEVYDFALGPKDYLFYLGPTAAASVQVGGFFFPTTVKSSDETPPSTSVTDDDMKFQTDWFVDGTFYHGASTPNNVGSLQGDVFEVGDFIFSYTTNAEITRKKFKDSNNKWVGIHGSAYTYPASFNAAGNHSIQCTFAHLPKTQYVGGFWVKNLQFLFRLFQKAVPITKNDQGATLTDGLTLSNVKSIDTLVFDKTTNRGDEVNSTWTVLVLSGSGFVNAVQAVDYNLGLGETLTSDVIHITFIGAAVSGGTYRVINTAEGYTSTNHTPFSNTFNNISFAPNSFNNVIDTDGTGDVTSNLDTVTVNLQVDPNGMITTVVEELNLPFVLPVFTPVSAYDNTTTNINPLTGIADYRFIVTANVDISSAFWTKTTNIYDPLLNTTTVTVQDFATGWTVSDWIAELKNRAVISCVVRLNGSQISNKTGLGPHTIKLGIGDYEVGYKVVPKTGGSVVFDPIQFQNFTLGA